MAMEASKGRRKGVKGQRKNIKFDPKALKGNERCYREVGGEASKGHGEALKIDVEASKRNGELKNNGKAFRVEKRH